MFGVVGSLYPYTDMSSADSASKVISTRLDFDRAETEDALTEVARLAKANSNIISATAVPTIAVTMRRVILVPESRQGWLPLLYVSGEDRELTQKLDRTRSAIRYQIRHGGWKTDRTT